MNSHQEQPPGYNSASPTKHKVVGLHNTGTAHNMLDSTCSIDMSSSYMITRLHKSRSSHSELEFDLSNFGYVVLG